MANIGAGETYHGYLIKAENITFVDSLIKESVPTQQIVSQGYMRPFRYRYLTESEMTQQQMRGWLKNTARAVIFTSETEIVPNAKDAVMLENGMLLRVPQKQPQPQQGMYMFSKKPPHILELQ